MGGSLEVTSYNEWGEGTQIEPAKKHRSQKGRFRFGRGQPGPMYWPMSKEVRIKEVRINGVFLQL